MEKEPNTFGGFTPEPGSKDAETASIEGQESMERRFGIQPERDDDLWNVDQYEQETVEQLEEKYREVYLNRKRTDNDTRDDAAILAELKSLLDNRKNIELWKQTSQSFEKLLNENLKTGKFSKNGKPHLDVQNAQIAWLNGLDMNDK